ncbi:DUF503 domain-containing protein [Clostridia bacterium OttesenSCG-928-F22]|nr:DUF503 domain-containing protein [Clostridia bacterium OttesenSCG-928-F22]
MYVESGIIHIRLSHIDSLKEKRAIINSVIGRLRSKYNASVAQVGSMELHGRADIGFSVVSNEYAHAVAQRESIISTVEGDYRLEVLDIEIL